MESIRTCRSFIAAHRKLQMAAMAIRRGWRAMIYENSGCVWHSKKGAELRCGAFERTRMTSPKGWIWKEEYACCNSNSNYANRWNCGETHWLIASNWNEEHVVVHERENEVQTEYGIGGRATLVRIICTKQRMWSRLAVYHNTANNQCDAKWNLCTPSMLCTLEMRTLFLIRLRVWHCRWWWESLIGDWHEKGCFAKNKSIKDDAMHS